MQTWAMEAEGLRAPSQWAVGDVCDWMLSQPATGPSQSVNWGMLAETLRLNEVDGCTLLSLVDEDLAMELDIHSEAERQALAAEIEALRAINIAMLCEPFGHEARAGCGSSSRAGAKLPSIFQEAALLQDLQTHDQGRPASCSTPDEGPGLMETLIAPAWPGADKPMKETTASSFNPASSSKAPTPALQTPRSRAANSPGASTRPTIFFPTLQEPMREDEFRLVAVGREPGSSVVDSAYLKPKQSRWPWWNGKNASGPWKNLKRLVAVGREPGSSVVDSAYLKPKQSRWTWWNSKNASGPPWPLKEACVACMEPFGSDTTAMACFVVSCGHVFCNACFRRSHEEAMKDASLIPVKCCTQSWDPEVASLVLPAQQYRIFRQRYEERICENFMYCPRPRCSAFINIDKLPCATLQHRCHACSTALCVECKVEYHPGLSCALIQARKQNEAHAEQAVKTLATQKKWQSCQRCGHLVELNYGCNHIACYCGYQFCYQCGAKWHTCACADWEEENLDHDARQRVIDEITAARNTAPVADFEFAARVTNAADNLRRNHECTHSWRRRQPAAANNCQNCSYRLWVYGFSCSDCGMVTCHTCRFHRMSRYIY